MTYRERAAEVNADRRQLTEEQRREVALALRQEGHSYRAIGGALGVAANTVRADVQAATVQGCTVDLPSVVTGLDGKVRAASGRTGLAARTPTSGGRC